MALRVAFTLTTLYTIIHADIIGMNCGKFPSVDVNDGRMNRFNLDSKTDCIKVEAKKCARAGCYNTSGFYICNEQDVEICVPMNEAVRVGEVGSETCSKDFDENYSYQVWTTNNGGYNVVESYANCQHWPPPDPDYYGGPNAGVNGVPSIQCGLPGFNDCGSQRDMCEEGSLVIEDAIVDWCAPYMLEQVVNAGHTYTYTKTRATTQGWTLGGQLGIKFPKGLEGKITFAWTNTATTGYNVGANSECGQMLGLNGLPGNWTCGMTIWPSCIRVEGYCDMGVRPIDPVEGEDPTLYADPILGKGKYISYLPRDAGEGMGVQTPQLCTCKDCEGWAEGGAPQVFCQLACPGCAPKPNTPVDSDDGAPHLHPPS